MGTSLPGCAPMSDVPWHQALAETLSAHAVDPASMPRFAALLELVRDDPTAPTTVTDPLVGVAAHVADSLDGLAVPAIRQAGRIADLGAGAGFPGLALALSLPGAHVHLVESLSRKCAFLERAIEAVEIANASVDCARAEAWPRRDLDVVTVRAVAPLNVLVEYAAPLLRIGGKLVAWKGRPEGAEVADGAAAAAVVGLEAEDPIALDPRPGADHRRLYLYSKARATPVRFPRRAGMARKRPLSA
jgi:16S rRNA (guanine527-N7)-methyltransferase